MAGLKQCGWTVSNCANLSVLSTGSSVHQPKQKEHIDNLLEELDDLPFLTYRDSHCGHKAAALFLCPALQVSSTP